MTLPQAQTAPSNSPRKMTNEEFFAFVELPENENLNFELINGEITRMPSPSALHGWIVTQLVVLLTLFVRPRNLGQVFGDNNDYVLTDDLVLKPDASFIAVSTKIPMRLHGAPDLAVEVMSPTNREGEMLEKVVAYLNYGSRLVWVIYPLEKMVQVYLPNETGYTMRRLTVGESLSGESALPGFTVSIADLFPPDNLFEVEEEDKN